ncbi:MAG: hypothetical protein ABIP49_08775 [Lysobacterales bacterium]
MRSFFAELKRRNVIRMAGLYLVGAWLITQVSATVLPLFGAPDWIARSVIVMLAIGFVPALVFAWVFELTPQGLKRDGEVLPGESIVPQTAQRMNRMIIAALLLAVVYFGFDKFVMSPQRESVAVASDRKERAVPTEHAPARPEAHDKSIAVLPFVNMSADKDNEYFSDGISEEILNALTKVEDLKVAGRTSSFFFKGRNENLTAIGETLGVAHVLEGSVRKQGEKVRITAQLIRTRDGFHLWSEIYDGDLSDVFALQENIARAITGKLQVILRGDQKSQLVQAGTSNPEAYALYLQSSAVFNRREGARYEEVIELLKQAIALDPRYARAHARLASLYSVNSNYTGGAAFSTALPNIELHARLASELDPSLAEPYAALGAAFGERRRFLEAHQSLERAVKLDPNDVTANFWLATQLISAGYIREGTAAIDSTLALDPMLPNALLWRARLYVFDGDLENAALLLRKATEGGHAFVGIGQALLDKARGDKAAAINSMTKGLAGYFTKAFPPEAAALFARAIYGDTDARRQSRSLIDAYIAGKPDYIAGVVPYVLMRMGEVGRGLVLAQDRPTTNDAMVLSEMFRQSSEIKGAPEFPEFARRSGLAGLWDAKGPPDFCRKNAKGDYACE